MTSATLTRAFRNVTARTALLNLEQRNREAHEKDLDKEDGQERRHLSLMIRRR